MDRRGPICEFDVENLGQFFCAGDKFEVSAAENG